jgi:hypothetical protein
MRVTVVAGTVSKQQANRSQVLGFYLLILILQGSEENMFWFQPPTRYSYVIVAAKYLRNFPSVFIVPIRVHPPSLNVCIRLKYSHFLAM